MVQVSVVVDAAAVPTQPAQLIQGPDGSVYVVLQDGQKAEAVFDKSLQQPPKENTVKVTPEPQVVDLTTQPDPKVINLSLNRQAQSNKLAISNNRYVSRKSSVLMLCINA